MLSPPRQFLAGFILLLFYSYPVYASETATGALPEPLTLELALQLIDSQHPDLRFADSELERTRSELLQAEAVNDLSVNIMATARWIEPAELAPDQGSDDHRLGLLVNKTLYDFGRSDAQVSAANQLVRSQNFQSVNVHQQQYLNVMKRYFDVVLADLQFYRYNEEMAVAYIQYDRIQTRLKLGQHTEVEVAEKEVEYQRVRRLRTHSQNQQRVTRSLLAQALNKPDDLPATVTRPELGVIARKLPDLDLLQKSISKNNPTLSALRAELVAAQNKVSYARSGSSPVLRGGLEAYSYSRDTGSTDKWRANLTLDIPLWSGNQVDAEIAKAKSQVHKVEALLARQELLVKQQALELWLKIEVLKVKYDEAVAGMNFSELSLDNSRALYELEVKSDLGYSMVKFSEAEREVVQTTFDIALAWAQLDALNGKLLEKK